MTIRFRPLPGFTLASLSMFVLLVGLGVWQLERLEWKLALIGEVTRGMHAAPINLDAALALGSHAQYRPVAVSGRFDNSREAYVFATASDGAPVYHVLTPLQLSDGRTLMVDRGIVPPALREPATRPGSEPRGDLRVVGIWRMPDSPGPFTPAPDLVHRIWYARDLTGIARALHLNRAAPGILEAEASAKGPRWPRGGQTRVDILNNHLQYALTWFLLAGALLVVYFAYHRAQGRLSLRKSANGHP